MQYRKSMLVSLLLLVGLAVPAYSEKSLSDPYQILEKHFAAIGGFAKKVLLSLRVPGCKGPLSSGASAR